MRRKTNTASKTQSSRQPKLSPALSKLFATPRRRNDGPFELTDEQKEAMKLQEPSEQQVAMLRELLRLTDSKIARLTKFDASEALDHWFATKANEPGSISAKQAAGLQKWGYDYEVTKDLSYNEAKQAFDRLGAEAKARRQQREA
jgi:hypothetical protein